MFLQKIQNIFFEKRLESELKNNIVKKKNTSQNDYRIHSKAIELHKKLKRKRSLNNILLNE